MDPAISVPDGRSPARGQRPRNELQLLSVSILETHRDTIEQLRALAFELDAGIGWHYVLDLAWVIERLPGQPGTAVDAGAGTGVLQWYMADRGWRVISATGPLAVRCRVDFARGSE